MHIPLYFLILHEYGDIGTMLMWIQRDVPLLLSSSLLNSFIGYIIIN